VANRTEDRAGGAIRIAASRLVVAVAISVSAAA
jgi:hypothetical protein